MRDKNDGEAIVHAHKKSRLRTKASIAFHRGSAYRGVSMNGAKWQALLMIDKTKRYLGTYKTAEEAAVQYDRHAFLMHGLKVMPLTSMYLNAAQPVLLM